MQQNKNQQGKKKSALVSAQEGNDNPIADMLGAASVTTNTSHDV